MSKEVVTYSVTREAIDDASQKEEYMNIIFQSHFKELLERVHFKNWDSVDIILAIEPKD